MSQYCKNKISLICALTGTGYGIASVNLLAELGKLTEVALFPINDIRREQSPDVLKHSEIIKRSLKNAEKWDVTSPSIRIWHQFDLSHHVGSPRINFPFFELDTFTEVEKHNLTSSDYVFTSSKWAKEIVEKEVKKLEGKVHVVPLGVDNSIFSPSSNNRSTTVFMNVGKHEVRKGTDLCVYCFNEAFSESDDVELWMSCENIFYSKEENEAVSNRYKNTKLGNKIKIIPRLNTQEELARLIKKSDIGLYPSRGEAWNLELLETLSCSKQVITTFHSGHTEYCNGGNAWLIPCNNLEPAYDGKWFFGNQGSWMKIDDDSIRHIIDNMRGLHNLKKLGNLGSNMEGIETARKYTWANAANVLLNTLERL